MRRVVVEPVRHALVLDFGHDERAGPHDGAQTLAVRQVEEAGEVALRVGAAGQVDAAVRQLVPQPRHIRRDGVAAGVRAAGRAARPRPPGAAGSSGPRRRGRVCGPAVDQESGGPREQPWTSGAFHLSHGHNRRLCCGLQRACLWFL